ncbi:hypothetical protein GGI43DRAFT_95381 [Trichoderma evansii]
MKLLKILTTLQPNSVNGEVAINALNGKLVGVDQQLLFNYIYRVTPILNGLGQGMSGTRQMQCSNYLLS